MRDASLDVCKDSKPIGILIGLVTIDTTDLD